MYSRIMKLSSDKTNSSGSWIGRMRLYSRSLQRGSQIKPRPPVVKWTCPWYYGPGEFALRLVLSAVLSLGYWLGGKHGK